MRFVRLLEFFPLRNYSPRHPISVNPLIKSAEESFLLSKQPGLLVSMKTKELREERCLVSLCNSREPHTFAICVCELKSKAHPVKYCAVSFWGKSFPFSTEEHRTAKINHTNIGFDNHTCLCFSFSFFNKSNEDFSGSTRSVHHLHVA